jgi:signal transduction histidine kinase
LGDDHFHNRFVEMRGVVRAVRLDSSTGDLTLDVSTPAGMLEGVVARFNPSEQRLPLHWVDVEARLHAVFSVQADPRRQRSKLRLFIQTVEQVTPDFEAVANAFAEMPRSYGSLMRFDASGSPEKRVHVHGVVTHQEPGRGFYLRDAGRGLWVQSPQQLAVERGDGVSAIGFVIPEGRHATMRDAILRKGTPGAVPEPTTLTMAQALSGTHHADFVQIDGELIEELPRAGGRSLLMEADGRRFRAELSRTAEGAMPRFPLGSRLRVSGICLNSAATARAADPRSADFQVLLRTTTDLALLRAASWWTPRRIATAIGGLLALSGATAVWGLMLRRRVAQQTAIIQQKLEREVIWEERNRIARELHDTLEQQLAAITIQLESASARLPGSPEAARESLGLMQAMVQHSRAEARRSVWDLRSHTLEQRGLAVALEELAATLSSTEQQQIEVQTVGDVRRVDRQAEFHLLRVAQEAMTNAVKHGHASHVKVELRYTSEALQLVVQDDGSGFDPQQPPSSGVHFGLLGMRERAAKINGRLLVESAPGRGTTVSVTISATPQELADSVSASQLQ